MCCSFLFCLIPHSCSLVSGPPELLWFPGEAMFFLTAHPFSLLSCCTTFGSDILAPLPGPRVQPIPIHHFMRQLPYPCPPSARLWEVALLHAPTASCMFQVIASPCHHAPLQMPVDLSSSPGTLSARGREHASFTFLTPSGNYYCTYLWNKLNQVSANQFDKL